LGHQGEEEGEEENGVSVQLLSELVIFFFKKKKKKTWAQNEIPGDFCFSPQLPALVN
jgi:hypothetical protein